MKAAPILGEALAFSLALAISAGAQEPDPVFSREIIDSQAAGPPASIALDRDGTPHVGYVDAIRFRMRYAHRTENGWIKEDVTDAVVREIRFTVSEAGQPFFNFGNAPVYSAVRIGASWSIVGLADCIGSSVSGTALGAAPDGSVHACAQYSCSGGDYYGVVTYAIWQDGLWAESVVGWCTLGISGTVSIAARSAAEPHISSWDNTTGSVDYYRKDGAGWVKEHIGRSLPASIGFERSANSIALDADGVPYVAYFDGVDKDLRLGVRGPQGWTTEAVDVDGDVGRSCSLAVGPDGSLHIAYFDATHGHVKYARRSPGATQWTIRVLASEGLLAEQVDLAVDAEGNVHIVFYDRLGQGTLLYATTRPRVAIQPTTWTRMRSGYR